MHPTVSHLKQCDTIFLCFKGTIQIFGSGQSTLLMIQLRSRLKGHVFFEVE